MLKKEQGIATSIFLLLLIPLFIAGMVYLTQQAQAVFHYDIDAQQAVTDAVRASAFSVDELSQANANPMIVPDDAYLHFKQVIAQNLNLDETTLEPKPGSALTEKPDFSFIVFNGTNDYGLPEGVSYPSGVSITGTLPMDFVVSAVGIFPGNTGEVVTTLDRPGCIAIVKCSMKANTNGGLNGTRWAAAQIVK